MLPLDQARELAASLPLDVDTLPICRLCLLDVIAALNGGREPAIHGALVRITPDMWAEGLEERAREIVRRLAEDLSLRARAWDAATRN